MIKADAIKALQDGKKVTHVYFSENEYIYIKDGILYDENGYEMTDFWAYRSGKEWKDGYEIYKNGGNNA